MSDYPSPQVIFNALDKNNIQLADNFYDEKIQFEDPLGQVQGRAALKDYYARMYENVIEIRFDFTNELWSDNEYVGFWSMNMRVRGLNSGKPIICSGNSYIRFSKDSKKAIYHRDYFDMGEFIYRFIPLLGPAVRLVKSTMKKRMHP